LGMEVACDFQAIAGRTPGNQYGFHGDFQCGLDGSNDI
jgi:hypothetical protein